METRNVDKIFNYIGVAEDISKLEGYEHIYVLTVNKENHPLLGGEYLLYADSVEEDRTVHNPYLLHVRDGSVYN